MLTPVQWYNGSVTDSWKGSLPVLLAAINSVQAQAQAHAGVRVGMLCNCGSEEVSQILDGMAALGWPIERTAFMLTDRATPTRSVVATPARKEFAASLSTSGVLSALPTAGNPAYAALSGRWHAAGFETSLFASACSLYDAVVVAAQASIVMGGGTTAGTAGSMRAAVNTTALFFNGVSGAMALDAEGDLNRAAYDVYAVDAGAGWGVVNASINARALP